MRRPDSSGGPLLNLRGKLVGTTTAITSPTGSNIGIGFAIPVNRVCELVDQAVRYGEAPRIGSGARPKYRMRSLFCLIRFSQGGE